MLAEEGILQVRADRHTHRPYGLQGGGPGAPSRNIMLGEGELPSKLTMTLRAGQAFRHELPGAGVGPSARAVSGDVAKDLRDGLVSIAGAARDYGVVAHGEPPVIDEFASAALRERLRGSRPAAPEVAWQPLDGARA